MRFVQFCLGSEIVPGVLAGEDHVVNLAAAASAYPGRIRSPIGSVLSLLRQGDQGLHDVQTLLTEVATSLARRSSSIPEGVVLERRGVKLTAPILEPQKIVGVGLNYKDHCEENNIRPPRSPVTFSKFPSAIIGPEEPILLHQNETQQVDYEAEFAVVMGKQARQVSEADAMECVAGYTIVNDVSARDIQFAEGQWVRAKSLDTFCPLGPAIVTKDELPDPPWLDIRCVLNGTVVQHSNTKNLLFGVSSLVSFLSKSITLLPGDVISTGTPGGVGYYRKPQLFLKPGDIVRVEIEQIGVLSNPVR